MKTRVICLIACLTMLFGSTVCVSAEGKTYTYCKADGTYEVRQGAIPTIDSRGIPVFYESAQGLVMESKVTTPGGNYVYGDWEAYYTPEQLNLLYSMIDGAGVTPGMSQYDKAVAINNYICSVARYADDIDAACRIPFGDGLIGMQMGGQLICGTYADLYQTMCEAVGIECRYEIGHVPTAVELHGWNIVTIDGKNYYVDVTWNDSLGNNAYLMSETLWADHSHAVYKDEQLGQSTDAQMRLAAPKKNWTPADYGKSWAWNENGWYEGSAMTQEEKAKVQEQLEIIKERNLNIDYNVWFIEIDGQLAGVYGRQLAGPDETELTETTKIPHHEKW